MRLVKHILADIAKGDLNDPSFSAYPLDVLLTFLNESLCVICQLKPEFFTQRKIIKLIPGTNDQVLPEFLMLHAIEGQSDKDGNILNYLRRAASPTKYNWSRNTSCYPYAPNQETLSSYSYEKDANKLEVFPAPKIGVDTYIVAMGVIQPQQVDETTDIAQIPCNIIAAITQWVLYRAKSIDSESAFLLAAAKDNYKTFFELLNITKAAKTAYETMDVKS